MMKKISRLALPLFVFWPFGAFLLSLLNLKSNSSAFIYIAFAVFVGYSMSFENSSADSYRYALAFARLDNTLNYNAIIDLYINGELRDLYRLLLFYLTSIFSNNPKVLYGLAGFVFGTLNYLSIRILIKEYGKTWDRYVFFLTLVFFTCISLANINGFRFWTGALVLFYTMYNSIVLNNKKWILGVLITPLIHYGFILIMPIIVLYFFLGRMFYTKFKVAPLLYWIFIFTFFISWVLDSHIINLGFLREFGVLPDEVAYRLDYLTREDVTDMLEKRREGSLFLNVQTYFSYLIKIYVFIAVLFLNKLLKRMNGDKIEYTRLFAFILFFYIVSFGAATFPGGARFLVIAHLFLFVLLAKFYRIYRERNIKQIITWSLLGFSFNIAFVNFMLPILSISPTLWYGNLFWIIIEGWDFHI